MEYRAISICVIQKLNSQLESALYRAQTVLTPCATLEEALIAISNDDYCLIVLDASALTTERARASVECMRLTTYAPILILAPPETASLLLKAGADVCIPEHVSSNFIVSHAMALLRRYTRYDQESEIQQNKRTIQIGDFYIDPLRRVAQVRGHPVELRPREFSLLLYFMRNPGIVLTSEQICTYAWGMEGSYNRGVSGPIAILRKAVEPDAAHPTYIETVSRIGYRFTAYRSETCDDCSSSEVTL